MEEQIKRPLTVLIPVSGLQPEEVLEHAKAAIRAEEIRAIQVTERTCLITLRTNGAKQQLIDAGINLKGRRWFPKTIDSDTTNITIKDAPVELSDRYLCTQMMRFGQIVPGSMRRGKIKGTNIENGTRYLQMKGIKNAVPVCNKFGRFDIRVFCDNNKTACKYCSLTDHEYFRCPAKPSRDKKCYICSDPSHLKKDCPNLNNRMTKRCQTCKSDSHLAKDCKQDVFCSFCGITGHRRPDCSAAVELLHGSSPLSHIPTIDYEEYLRECREVSKDIDNSVCGSDGLREKWSDIVDSHASPDKVAESRSQEPLMATSTAEDKSAAKSGKSTTPTDHVTPDSTVTAAESSTKNVHSTPKVTKSPTITKIVFGASNCVGLHMGRPDTKVFAQSGTTAAKVQMLINDVKADDSVSMSAVDTVIINLGTNDIVQKGNSEQVEISLTVAVATVRTEFTNVKTVGFSSIPPRQNRQGQRTQAFNDTAHSVNRFMQKFCNKDPSLVYIDNACFAQSNGQAVASLYNPSDKNGLHFNMPGRKELVANITNAIEEDSEWTTVFASKDKKRSHSQLSATPTSADKHDAKRANKDIWV